MIGIKTETRTMCLGIFLKPVETSDGMAYKRVGVGQMSWAYVKKCLDKQDRDEIWNMAAGSLTGAHQRWDPHMTSDDNFREEQLTTMTLI